jgi:hypothetical protein
LADGAGLIPCCRTAVLKGFPQEFACRLEEHRPKESALAGFLPLPLGGDTSLSLGPHTLNFTEAGIVELSDPGSLLIAKGTTVATTDYTAAANFGLPLSALSSTAQNEEINQAPVNMFFKNNIDFGAGLSVVNDTDGSGDEDVGFMSLVSVTPAADSPTRDAYSWYGPVAIAGTHSFGAVGSILTFVDASAASGAIAELVGVDSPVAFASLPSCASGTKGTQQFVTDSNTNTWVPR